MAKCADQYFGCDPWKIIENGFDPKHAKVSESIFALANERIGVRGYFDEGGTLPSLRGSYVGGVYELEGDPSPGGYKGIVKQTHYMVTAADPFGTDLWVAGERLDLGLSRTEAFKRQLELRTGKLERSFIWKTANGGRISCRFERLLGMEDPQWAMQRLTLTALDKDAEAEVFLGLDGNLVHQTYQNCLWQEVRNEYAEDISLLELQTGTTEQRVRYAMKVRAASPMEPVREHRLAGVKGRLRLPKGEEVALERAVSVQAIRQAGEAFGPLPAAWPSFKEMLAESTEHYAAFWSQSDVEILGDPENQQGIRFCLFQLHQTYRGENPRDNIGAKGLTGEAYNGHAFWDTETYCLPYYLLNDEKAAKSLLMYRYHTLPQAMARAKELDLEGACYPIATLNGKEACTLWQHASLQMQPSTAVAYGIEIYARQSGDKAFLHREGAEMLVQICRYLASRGDWNQDQSAYGYYGVMGPDEFHLMVNNNYYTNYMGQKTIRYTLEVISGLSQEERRALAEKTGVGEAELTLWKACADKMLLLQDEKGLREQHEGYFSLPHLEVDSIPMTDFPLYEHWSYDRIYRTDMIKQPDVLMAMFLYPGDFSQEAKRVNYDYYEPRCIHESSLSPSIHSVLAAELGREQEAFDFFGYATRLDLDDYNRNTCDGLHTTGIAAAWMTIVMGFGGLRMDGEMPTLSPMLPEQWKGFSFSLLLGESRIRVLVEAGSVTLLLLAGPERDVLIYGRKVTVTGRELRYPMKREEAI